VSDQETCHGCGAQVADAAVLCNRCVRITERRLGDLPALIEQLELTVSRQARGGGRGGGHRKKGDDQPLPFNIAASGKRSLIALLEEWADVVAQGAGIRGLPLRPAVTTDTNRVRAAVGRMLTKEALNWLRNGNQAAGAFDAIWSIRDQLRSAIDRRPERLYAGPCNANLSFTIDVDDQDNIQILDKPSRCSRGLYRKWGDEVITCDGYDPTARIQLPLGCGATHTAAERRDFLLASVEDHLLPLRVVWESLYVLLPDADVTWETARKWPRRQRNVPPRLNARAITDQGDELYRGGDILDLARDDAPRVGRRRQRVRRVSA
jgi:hypothetical protein